jgi:ABC-type multidrug transport system ATPase subunit
MHLCTSGASVISGQLACDQDDLLHESLTVWEVLYYAAMLRLPRTMSKADKKERVSTVIKALGIESCKDTIIGETLPSA